MMDGPLRASVTDAELIAAAEAVVNRRQIARDVEVGSVGAALVTSTGRVFTGVCIDTACSLGFCAEHAAIAAMVTAGETEIHTIVAVGDTGRSIVSPCGRCRELIYQFGHATRILMPRGRVARITELLPEAWERRD